MEKPGNTELFSVRVPALPGEPRYRAPRTGHGMITSMERPSEHDDDSWFEREMASIAAGERNRDLLGQLDGIRAQIASLQFAIGNGYLLMDAINTDLSAMAQDLELIDRRMEIVPE